MDHFVFTLRPMSISEPFILLMSNSLPLSPHSALYSAEFRKYLALSPWVVGITMAVLSLALSLSEGDLAVSVTPAAPPSCPGHRQAGPTAHLHLLLHRALLA